MSGEGFGYEFLKSMKICFCVSNMKNNVGIDTKLPDYLTQETWLRKTIVFFSNVIDVFLFSSYSKSIWMSVSVRILKYLTCRPPLAMLLGVELVDRLNWRGRALQRKANI